MLQALQNNNPLLLSKNICFWYSQCLFVDVLMGILVLSDLDLDYGVHAGDNVASTSPRGAASARSNPRNNRSKLIHC